MRQGHEPLQLAAAQNAAEADEGYQKIRACMVAMARMAEQTPEAGPATPSMGLQGREAAGSPQVICMPVQAKLSSQQKLQRLQEP